MAAEPIRHRGERVFVWSPEPGLWLTVLWGVPTAADIAEMVDVHELGFRAPTPFASLVDIGEVTLVDPIAFDAMVAYATRRRADFDRQITRQALVRPPGMIGALVTGFFESFGFTLPVRAFDDRRAALAWLRPDDGAALARDLGTQLTTVAALAPSLRRLREALSLDHDDRMDLPRCARRLGVSERTLQRQLRELGTSFRAELSRARIDAAKRLLQAADCKLAAVALQVGFATPQSFAAAFREQTGETPSAWRRRWIARG